MYLVQGVHPVVPGCPRSLWFTAEGANKAAAELVNILLEDWRSAGSKASKPATAEDWQARLNAARTAKHVSEADADVWIEELTPGDAPPPPAEDSPAAALAKVLAGYRGPFVASEMQAMLASLQASTGKGNR
jgi:hypothetical protein